MSKRLKFAKYTEKIRAMLPFWFKMKKQPNESLGLQFLNFFGLEFDDIYKMLNYAYNQNKIMKMDDTFPDIIYKAILPTYFDVETIDGVVTDNIFLKRTETLYDFLQLSENYGFTEPIHQPNYYFVDKSRKIIYVREAYDVTADHPDGIITVLTKISDGTEEFEVETTLHHVWNFFDEFGALLSCPRLYGEKNYDYKNRILDVFKNHANSTKKGLANGIARELGLRKFKVWTDPTEDFIIKDKMVLANLILVENDIVDLKDVYISTEGYLVLRGNPYDKRKNLSVSYISGLEMRALTDHSDNKFNNETYKANSMPTDLMLDYINNIKQNSSVLWGDFKYNDGMWVTDDEEFSNNHFGFIPSTFNASIKGFAKYGFFNK